MNKIFIEYLTTSIITLNKVKNLALFATNTSLNGNNYYIIAIDSFVKPLDFKKYYVKIPKPKFALSTMCKNDLSYLKYITKIIWEGLVRTNKGWCI